MNKSDYYHKYLTEIQPHRDVTRANFASGQMRYRIYLGDQEGWNPYESFFKIRCSLSQADGTPLLDSDGVAPNIFLGDSLFQSMRLSCNDKVLNEQTDYCHQISVLRQRLNKPDQWLEGAGKSLNFTQESIRDRIAQVSIDGLNQSDDYISFRDLKQSDDTSPLGTEELKVQAASLNLIEYTAAADGGNGGVNLTETRLKPGMEIHWFSTVRDRSFRRTIRLIEASQLTVDRPFPAAIVNEDILNNVHVVLSSEKQTKNKKEFEILWKPGLGVFQEINGKLPGGCSYEVMLTPFPSLVVQKNAIESLIDKRPGVGNDYLFEVINMNMYVCKYESHNPSPKGDLEICFDEIRCQAQTLNTTSLTQKNYDVHPMTHSLSVAYQDNRAGNDTRFSRGKFKIQGDKDLNLTRIYLQYANMTLPNPIPDLEYSKASSRDFFSQRYIETQLYSKGIMHPSVEPLHKFYSRGPIYHWKWPRSFDRKHEAVIVSQNFSGNFDGTDNTAIPVNTTIRPQVLLFDWHKKMVKFEMSGNRVSKVSAY